MRGTEIYQITGRASLAPVAMAKIFSGFHCSCRAVAGLDLTG